MSARGPSVVPAPPPTAKGEVVRMLQLAHLRAEIWAETTEPKSDKRQARRSMKQIKRLIKQLEE